MFLKTILEGGSITQVFSLWFVPYTGRSKKNNHILLTMYGVDQLRPNVKLGCPHLMTIYKQYPKHLPPEQHKNILKLLLSKLSIIKFHQHHPSHSSY